MLTASVPTIFSRTPSRSWPCSAASVCETLAGSDGMSQNLLMDARIVARQNGMAFHRCGKNGNPNASKSHERGEVQPVKMKPSGIKRRFYFPKCIQDPRQKNQRCHRRQNWQSPRYPSEKQRVKGHEEMKNGYPYDDPFPTARDAMQIPANFGRKVAGINNEQL